MTKPPEIAGARTSGASVTDREEEPVTVTSIEERLGESAEFVANLENGSEEWLNIRAAGIGGSEVGTICGLNPWESPFTLWAKKTGRIESSIPQNEAMEWGNRLEPVVLDKFADAHPELVVHRDVGTWAHKVRSWQIANPDAIFENPETGEVGVIEVKTAQYEDAWSEGVPKHYEAQVLWYLQTFGLSRAHVVVLFHGNRYREYEVLSDPDAQDYILERATYMKALIDSDTQPEFDGALSTYQTVRALHPSIEDDEVELGWLGVQYFAIEEAYKAAESELTEVKSNILSAMGSAKRGLVEGDWTFSRQARGAGDPYLVVKRG
jgi:putative phage-type endonuclease